MSKYLDETGLTRVWSNIKTYLGNNYVARNNTGITGIWVGNQTAYNNISSKSSTVLYIIT